MPRIFGGVEWVGGGVGGTSPVTLTKASIPAQSNLRAVIGPIVKTSRLFGDGGKAFGSSFWVSIASPASAEGFGRGGKV